MNSLTIGMLAILTCTQSPPTIDQILDGIRMVESSGGKNKRDGDNGKAIGPYQIHKSYWTDGTRILKVKWPYENARQEQYARKVVKAYITHYGKKHGWEAIIRVHNGGPSGYKKKSTFKYLRKVKVVIEEKEKK